MIIGSVASARYKFIPQEYLASALPGSYILAGQAAFFKNSRLLNANSGTYSLSGTAANLSTGIAGAAQYRLLEDGSSNRLLEDGTSKRTLE